MLKKSTGPAKPADLLRKNDNPLARAQSAKTAKAAKSGASDAAEPAAEDGDCTCGAEVGKKLEALGGKAKTAAKAGDDYGDE